MKNYKVIYMPKNSFKYNTVQESRLAPYFSIFDQENGKLVKQFKHGKTYMKT